MKNVTLKQLLLGFLFPALLFLNGCASYTPKDKINNTQHQSVFITANNDDLLHAFAPVFLINNDIKDYNLIGTPSVRIQPDNTQQVIIDPQQATLYAEQRNFSTDRDTYTNLIYRVHFKKTPGGFTPYYLGKGKNVGHIIIVTLNSKNKAVLYTSVHSCGCYLAFVPTSHLDKAYLPKNWNLVSQNVFSKTLPGLLNLQEIHPHKTKVVFEIAHATHRVQNVVLADFESLQKYTKVVIDLQPLASLEKLLLNDEETTSFYETSGPRQGYVKGSYKPRERLWMSWWAFDWRIGEDKKLGQDATDGPVFYTSIKPWAREASDMRNFPAFLDYWGWNL